MFQRLGILAVIAAFALPQIAAAQTPCFSSTRALGKGSRGPDVAALQRFLMSQSMLAQGNATGYFGVQTENAVKAFQGQRGIAVQGGSGFGTVGPKTRAVIARVCSEAAAYPQTSNAPFPGNGIIKGIEDSLKFLQDRLANGSEPQGGSTQVPQPSNTTNVNEWQSVMSQVYAPSQSQTTQTQMQQSGTGQTNSATTGSVPQTSAAQPAIAGSASCSFNGQTIAHGSSVTAYQSASVPAGAACTSQSRTCGNGTLTGSYTAASCTMQSTYTHTGKLSANASLPSNYSAGHEGVINKTGGFLVLKSLDVDMSAAPYQLGAAAIDVCLAVGPYDMNQAWTANSLEVLCYSMYKSASASEWPQTHVRYEFPGQGLLISPNTWVVVGSQGNTTIPHNNSAARRTLSDFKYSLVFAKADPNGTAPVQSIRIPYADQSFYTGTTRSAQQFHSNYSQGASRSIVGLSYYIATSHYEDQPGSVSYNTVYMSSNIGSAGWVTKHQLLPYYGGDGIQGGTIVPQNIRFNYGDATAAYCDTDAAVTKAICAFYMFVTVPTVNGSFAPLPVNSTIDPGQANVFCSGSPSGMSDSRFSNYSYCYNYLTTPFSY